MNFDQYQHESRRFAIYPDAGQTLVYPTLGLAGEAGEVAEKVKKIIRDHGGVIADEQKVKVAQELGDVLWYVAQLATTLGFSLDDIAQQNIEKLSSRFERGAIFGDGDNR